jgi:uncharacterized membrane protein
VGANWHLLRDCYALENRVKSWLCLSFKRQLPIPASLALGPLRSRFSPSGISLIAPTDFAKLMKAFTDLHLKTYFSILIMVLFGPLGNVLLGKGMKRIGAVAIRTPAELIHTLLLVFSSSVIWLGIACLITFFITYMLVLSWADYSYVQPASSIAYGVVALLGHFLLKEVITPTRWLGVLVICLGVFIVSGTPPRTTEQV